MLFAYCKTGVFFAATQLPPSPISDNCRMCVPISFPRARVACAQRAPLYSEFAFFAVTSVTIPLGLICEK